MCTICLLRGLIFPFVVKCQRRRIQKIYARTAIFGGGVGGWMVVNIGSSSASASALMLDARARARARSAPLVQVLVPLDCLGLKCDCLLDMGYCCLRSGNVIPSGFENTVISKFRIHYIMYPTGK